MFNKRFIHGKVIIFISTQVFNPLLLYFRGKVDLLKIANKINNKRTESKCYYFMAGTFLLFTVFCFN